MIKLLGYYAESVRRLASKEQLSTEGFRRYV